MGDKLHILPINVGMFQTNCYIVTSDNARTAVVIDPGDEADSIAAAVRGMNADLTAILLTHAHYDHICAVNELKAMWPDLLIYASLKEKPMFLDPALNSGFGPASYKVMPDVWLTEDEPLSFFGKKWTVLETPGHTAGSICFYIADDGVLFAGDTIFRRSYGRYDLPTGSLAEIRESLKRLLTSLPEETVVYTGHGRVTKIGEEKTLYSFS